MPEGAKANAGRPVDDSRVRAALRGQLALSALSRDEGARFNSHIAAAVQGRIADTHYGEALAARGVTSVALSADGQLVEYCSDGTTHLILPSD